MGCGTSKQAVQAVADAEATSGSQPVNGNGKQLSHSLPSSGSGGPAHSSAAPSPRPPSRAPSAARELRPEQLVAWKLHPEEAASQTTSKTLESIKDVACLDLGVRKSKVGLFGIEQLWFRTAAGGFSPGMPFHDTGMGQQFAAFQASPEQVSTALIIPDLTKVPLLRDNPATTERPHVTFSATALVVSRTGAGKGHAMGVIILWDTKPGPQFSPEQETRLVAAADAARAALQRELFRSLGIDDGAAAVGAHPPELPAVWVDLADPDWRVLGINPAWETLTGVGLDVLEGFPGILTVLVPSDGRHLAAAWEKAVAAATTLPPDRSLPLVLSPCAPAAGTLQYVMALRRADGPPPLPASGPSETSGGGAAPDPWILECHACLQADDHRGQYSSGDLISSLFSDSEPGSGVSDRTGTPVASSATSPGGLPRASTPAVATTPSIPPRLASLHLGQLLGSGSYANVYAGRLGDRPVAVKIMLHSYGPDARKDDWLSHYEAFSTVEINHDNVIATLDWARLEDVGGWAVWIVQELAEKGSLSAAIARGVLSEGLVPGAPADMRAVLATAREIARGMRYLHSMDEIHGDLSSNNVMLVGADNPRGFVAKVSDFGLSRLEGAEALTQTVGTVTHMAPELLTEGRTSKASDVFSFGVILWELWAGERAWAGLGQHQVIFAVACRGERIEMPPEAPEEYARLATQCMAPQRKDRPTFSEVVPRIDAMLAALGPPPRPGSGRLL